LLFMRYLEFPVEEMKQKINNARKLILEQGLAGLMITAEANYYYFTGYRPHTSWSTFTRPAFLFIPKDKEPVLLVHIFVVPEAQSRSAVRDVRGFREIMTTPLDDVVEILRELEMDRGQVGCEFGYEQRLGIPHNAMEELKTRLPSVQFVDGSDLIWKLRMVKLPSEIECMRKVCQITSQALDQGFREIHEGMTEKEISQKISSLMLAAGAEAPGFIIICSGPGNYDRISARATDRRIVKGDFVWLDVGANYLGYWSDFCRAGVVGGPTAEARRLQAIVHEVTMAACQKIAPGVPVAEIARECAKQMEAHGFPLSFDCGRAGHGIGLMSTEPPSIVDYDTTVLEPGMIITVEPGIVNELGCFDIEENVLVTEDGFEILSGASRDLYTIATV
jgi:Xaa-Pro aminopeptidase